jgi:Uma2 family endonuclease
VRFDRVKLTQRDQPSILEVYLMTSAYQLLTLEKYLAYDNGTDQADELVNGVLVSMPPESFRNQRIGIFLLFFLARMGMPENLLVNHMAIAVAGGRATARIPDLILLSAELVQELQASNQGTILEDMPPPRLVVEVVSPGQEDRDYRYKRSEYAVRQIPEYWIVDPMTDRVTVLELVAGFYEEQVYVGETLILSPQLGQLQLSAQDILAA